jgi:hypothetical protein
MIRVPWQKTTGRARKEPIRWTRGNSKYELYSATLESVELEDVLAHCKLVKHKVRQVVSNNNHLGPSYFEVFPRTLEQELEDAWQPAVEALGVAPAQTVANFDTALKSFIAHHATSRDRHALVQQLSHPTKPSEMSVQVFQHRLMELNNSVELLPGTSAKLTDDQLKQAFYDGMPSNWKHKFITGGSRYEQMTLAEVVVYFRDLEYIERKERKGGTPSEDKTKAQLKKKRANTSDDGEQKPANKKRMRFRNKKNKPNQNGLKAIFDDYQCPIHPMANHTWGECFSRKKLKNGSQGNGKSKEKDKSKGKPVTTQSFVAALDEQAPEASSGEEGMSFFNSSVVVQLDDYLTSTPLTYTSQDCDADEQVERAFCMAVEDSYASGIETDPITGKEISLSRTNVRKTTMLPIGIMTVTKIQGQEHRRPLKVLFDSGSMVTLINPRVLSNDMVPHALQRPLSLYTAGGPICFKQGVTLQTIRFPELSPTKSYITSVEAVVSQHTRQHDVILGIDVLVPAGIDLRPSEQTIQWGDLSVPWRPHDSFSNQSFPQALRLSTDRLAPEPEFDSFTTQLGAQEILSSKYDEVNTSEMAQKQVHLSQGQRDQLSGVLKRYSTLFSGKLGCYPGRKVHLDVDKDAKPFHSRPYPIPHVHRQVFKEELDRLVELGVLSKTGPSKFLSPTFIIPKKDGRVRFVSDFRKLNKILCRKVYHLPIIHDILRKRSGYRYFTKLDISMQYYTFELHEESKEVCTICTPFGNYQYNRLPMGVKQAPDVAQEIMEELL